MNMNDAKPDYLTSPEWQAFHQARIDRDDVADRRDAVGVIADRANTVMLETEIAVRAAEEALKRAKTDYENAKASYWDAVDAVTIIEFDVDVATVAAQLVWEKWHAVRHRYADIY